MKYPKIQSFAKILFYHAIFLAIILITIFLFHHEIMNFYFSSRYANQYEVLKKHLFILREVRFDSIDKITTPESTVRRRSLIVQISPILKKLDLNSLKISDVYNAEEEGKDTFFFEIYVNDDPDFYIRIKLKYFKDDLLLESIIFSDVLLRS